jgi:hypothetical protein
MSTLAWPPDSDLRADHSVPGCKGEEQAPGISGPYAARCGDVPASPLGQSKALAALGTGVGCRTAKGSKGVRNL